MASDPWTDAENDLIVAEYFAMRKQDCAGYPYNKAEHRRALLPLLRDRSEGSIEFKHQNISAVLTGLREAGRLFVGPPPTLSNAPLPQELEQMLHVARKFDVAGRDARNRALGRAEEAFALAHEQAALRAAGRDDLARAMRWVSDAEGNSAGYDIASFTPEGPERLLEVKTTNGWERTPFHITCNELAVADARRGPWCLFRLWNFTREPRAF